MQYMFRNFNRSYFEKVHEFLIELSMDDHTHINWNWARWEWMFFHPEFDKNSLDKIGLWFFHEDLVGVAIYDYYFGEAFFATKKGFEELEKDILDYMVEKDLYKHHELLWKGFDHEGEVPLDEDTIRKQKEMLSAPHLNTRLHVIAKNKFLEFVSYCGLWYNKSTDYVYVEPVCTIPQYRKKGIAKCILTEALKRAYDLGAKKAYVISDMEFYKRLGFKQHSHYTFYWYNN